MNADLIFEEPPPLHSGRDSLGRSPLGLWLAALRDHPGKWAKFPEPMSSSVATDVRKGRGLGVTAGEFEVRTVTTPGHKKMTIYARYVGTSGLGLVATV